MHRDVFFIMKANEMHYFLDLFDKVLYMFWTVHDQEDLDTVYTQYMLVQLASASRRQHN